MAKVCSLDIKSNTIKVWHAGTGKLIGENPEQSWNFKGYKTHVEWDASTLVYIDKNTLNKLEEEEHYQNNVKALNDSNDSFDGISTRSIDRVSQKDRAKIDALPYG